MYKKPVILTLTLLLSLTPAATDSDVEETYEKFPVVFRVILDVPIFFEFADGSSMIGSLRMGEMVLYLGLDDSHEMMKIETVDGSVGWMCSTLNRKPCLERMPTDPSRRMDLDLHDEGGNPVVGASIEFVDGLVRFTTDEEGHVRVEGVPEGAWDVLCRLPDGTEVLYEAVEMDWPDYEGVELTLETGYRLAIQVSPLRDPDDKSALFTAGKPNIYLYPEEETDVMVWLSFVGDGRLTVSEPEYIQGWDVTVTPEGRITAYEPVFFLDPDTGEHWPIPARGEPSGEYGYLFYEGNVEAPGQVSRGWLVDREELEDFFQENLAAYGFEGREIDDFLEFWIPRLNDYPLFAVYPQLGEDYEKLVSMAVYPRPDSVLRLVYAIRGLFYELDYRIAEPEIPAFEREGFTVVEWGVILSPEDAENYLH